MQSQTYKGGHFLSILNRVTVLEEQPKNFGCERKRDAKLEKGLRKGEEGENRNPGTVEKDGGRRARRRRRFRRTPFAYF